MYHDREFLCGCIALTITIKIYADYIEKKKKSLQETKSVDGE
jgi:hypothetical protein